MRNIFRYRLAAVDRATAQGQLAAADQKYHGWARLELGLLYTEDASLQAEELAHYRAAEKSFRELLEQYPNEENFFVYLGSALLNQANYHEESDPDEALRLYAQARVPLLEAEQRFPKSGNWKLNIRNAYWGEGRVWLKRKEYPRTADAFRKAILYNTDQKDDVTFRQRYAYALLKLGEVQKGEEELFGALEQEPHDEHAMLFFSRLHVVLSQLVAQERRAEQLDKGIEAFEQSMSMDCSCARDQIQEEDFLPIANHPAILQRLAQ